MADELLDLVNEKDQVIGEVWKSEAHKNPKRLHREIGVIIFDDKNKILFQKRSSRKKINPGVWAESCAGHVPKGIEPLVAAHTELQEELGFDTKLEYFTKTIAALPYEMHFTYWYVGKYQGEKIHINKEEVDRIEFLSRSQLERLVKNGEKYNPKKYGGHSEDVVERFWRQLKTK